MRAAFEKVATAANESLRVIELKGSCFLSPWHYHPEIELTLIREGEGLRYVGDSLLPFQRGDLVLLGPDLPHFWKNHTSSDSRPEAAQATVIQFRQEFLGAEIWEKPEFQPVARLLRRSRRGLRFPIEHRDRDIVHSFQELSSSHGLPRVLRLIEILDQLAHAIVIEELANPGFSPDVAMEEGGRVEKVCSYVLENLTEPLSQRKASALAGLSPAAFCRFFRRKTGKSFVTFVNEARIGRAVWMLLETDQSVSQIAYACGFNNLSNFNRRFRALKGMSPREFLRSFQGQQTETGMRAQDVSY